MSNVLDIGEVEIPRWKEQMGVKQLIAFREVERSKGLRAAFVIQDINYVRTEVRRLRRGEAYGFDTEYRVKVTWPEISESAIWTFGPEIGWPVEDGVARNWRAEWLENYGGVA